MFSSTAVALARQRMTLSQYYKAVGRVVPRGSRITGAQRSVLRTLYVASPITTKENEAQRVALGKRVVVVTAPTAVRATPSRPHKPAKKPRSPAKTKRPSAQRTPYQHFRDAVIAKGHLTPSAALNERIFRLWLMTAPQSTRSASSRVNMAVRLIRKTDPKMKKKKKQQRAKSSKKSSVKGSKKARRSHHKKKKGSASPKKRKAAKKAKKPKKAKKAKPAKKWKPAKKTKKAKKPFKKVKKTGSTSKKSVQGRPGHNPYLRFYRELVHTGLVPNHPKGARSRRVKELWRATGHLKTMESRLKLSKAYLSGAQQMPAIYKKSARKSIKSAAKAGRKPEPIVFKVPHYYHRTPFSATFSALFNYAYGTTTQAKMRTVAKAWRASRLPGKDNRSPRQRIMATARLMRRK